MGLSSVTVLISGMDLVPATFKSEGFFQDNQFSWYMMRKNTRLHQWFLVYEYSLFIKVERILALQCISDTQYDGMPFKFKAIVETSG